MTVPVNIYTGWPTKNGTVDTVNFSGLCSDQQINVPRNSGNRANPENDSPKEIAHKVKSFQPNLMILVLL